MHPVLFNIGPVAVHSYGFMLAAAFIAGIAITLHYARKAGISGDHILELAIYVILAAIVGSRLLYVIGQWDQFRENPLEIVMVQRGGLAFLGGFILALAVVVFYARFRKIPLLRLLDVLAPGLSLGYAIARIGCFLNGCCFGRPTQCFLGVAFPPGSLAYFQYPDEKVHPTQLYALAIMLAVFLAVVFLWQRKRYDGQVFFWWMIGYGLYRFTVEFFRYCPPALYFLGLNPGQYIALLILLVGISGLLRKRAPGA